VDWVLSPTGQAVVASYKIDGEQLFFPNAGR
jgi:tungstate transport system substrate-binding protein